jgi:very-short-patch-repair endonuclease
MTKVEWFIWSRLRGRQVGGYKFRRQVPLGPYFADFFCPLARLVVEIDGEGHEQERDDRKTVWLERQGYRVLRFLASDVDDSIDDVMDAIYFELTREVHSPHPARSLREQAVLPAWRGGEISRPRCAREVN